MQLYVIDFMHCLFIDWNCHTVNMNEIYVVTKTEKNSILF